MHYNFWVIYFAAFSQPAAPFSSVDISCYFLDSDPSLGWSGIFFFVQLPYLKVHIQRYYLYPCVDKIKAELKAQGMSKKLVSLWSDGQQCSWRQWKTLVWSFTCCRAFSSTWLTDGLRCMSPNISKTLFIINLYYFAELVKWFAWFFS